MGFSLFLDSSQTIRIMKNYEELREICERTSRISARVVDDFLISYAAGHRGLEKQMDQQFDRYRHLKKQLGKQVINMLKSQFLALKVFRQEGLLERFLKHPALEVFKGEEREYLLQQLEQPWRFSFSVIVDRPAEDFFRMEDVFTGEQFLLFSPGVSDIMISTKPVLWFNLIGFNGACWQSYGPVVYYNGFEPGDIWFFATELDPGLEDPGEIYSAVNRDPVPFMMLVSGSTLPLTFHKEDQMLFLLAEHDLEHLDTAGFKKEFKTEYDQEVYRLSLKEWGEHPHFAQAYFDEKEHLLLFSAMSDRGFVALVEAFNAFGFDFPAEPYLRVNMTMLSTASEILKTKIVLNEYLDLFEEESDPDKDKLLEDINAFIALVLPDINAGREPNIEEAARVTGVDPETARSVVASVMGNLEGLPGKVPEPDKTSSRVKKRRAVVKSLPAQPRDGIRLLSSDDEQLFDLHLYVLADDLRRLAPWEFLHEDELFGVQVPGSDLVYFVSVMGQAGELPAVSFWKGYEGLTDYLEFTAELEHLADPDRSASGMQRASVMPGNPMTIPHLLLSFNDREQLQKEDLAAIKKSGVRFRGNGNWPCFEEIVPGYVPVYPGRASLKELFLVLQQTLILLKKVQEDEYYLQQEGSQGPSLLIRTPAGKGPRFRWKEHMLEIDPRWGETSYLVDVSSRSRQALVRLPEANQELQLDLIMLPAAVKEKGSKSYFPFVLLMVDKYSGLVTSTSVLAPKPDLRSLYESLPQKVVEELLKLGHRPSEIEIRPDLLFELLDEILGTAACRVSLVEEMPEMDEAIGSMISHMS